MENSSDYRRREELYRKFKVDTASVVRTSKSYDNCPKGRDLLVMAVHDDGSITGINLKNNSDRTEYTVQKGDYIILSEYRSKYRGWWN